MDDGPRDGSTEMIRGLRLSRNFGHEATLEAGLRDARDAAWEEGTDVVYAVRRNRKEGRILRLAFSGF